MEKEELVKILVQMGFDSNDTDRIIKYLLDQFISKGFTLKQALNAIAAELRSRGKLFRKLQAFPKKKQAESPSALEGQESCPMCGYPKPAGKGVDSAKECANCGVIFAKIMPTGKDLESLIKDLDSLFAMGEIIKPIKPASQSTLRQFASRHKVITIIVSVLLFLFFVGLITQGFYKFQHKRLLTAFEKSLKMDTKEEFETSLENIQYFIEYTAILVARRGWSEREISNFSNSVGDGVKRFNEKMEAAVPGESRLFGYDLQEIKNNLCAGEKMVILCIRDKKSALMIAAFTPKLAFCDAAQYKTSSKTVLVRDGKNFILKYREKSDSSEVLNAKQDNPLEPKDGKQTSVKRGKTGNELYEARILLFKLQEDYRRRYKNWCTDDQELIAVSKANGHVVPPATEELVKNGSIGTEIVNGRVMIKNPRVID